MGGDFAPANVVAGAIDAVRESGGRFSILLVGDEQRVRDELSKNNPLPESITKFMSIEHSSETIDMNDAPNAALKTKKKSSIAVGIELHRDKKADAFVSAGNTGAVLSASTLILGRIPGVSRPTIGALIPTMKSPMLLLDAGTNVDCRPQHLYQFALMGSIYFSAMFGKSRPSVGLLSIGEEKTKGNETSLDAFALLTKSTLDFMGNIEGRDILTGKVDVVVCDGFVGNILLKFGESVPAFLKSKFKDFAEKGLLNKLKVLLVRNSLRSILKDLDYQEHGGVPLLGVNGVSIIGHGGSTPKAIKNMIYRAEEMVRREVNERIRQSMANHI